MNNKLDGLDELMEAWNNASEEARDLFLYQETGIEVGHPDESDEDLLIIIDETTFGKEK